MSDEERDVPAAQQAMKQLTLYINATDREIKRLTLAETHLSERERLLTEAVRESERQTFESREEVRRLTEREKLLNAKVAALTTQVEKGDDDLRRRAEEAEGRAALYEEQNSELKEQAELGEKLAPPARKMIAAIESLPVKMEDATIIRSVAQDIPLYGTYEWQAVSDARFLILRALGEPTEEMGS